MADNSSCTSSRSKKSKTKKKKLIDHRTLRVSNLPSNVTIHTLSDYFSDCSIPVRLHLHDDKSAAFIEFPSERDAAEALISATNKYPFLRIIYATKTKLKPYSLTSIYPYPQRLVAMVPPNHIIQRQNGQGPRTAAEERRIIQQALEIVFEQRLGEYGNCERCKARTTKKCSNCGTFYCSKDCQLIDWNIHQHFCSDGADGESLPTPRNISDQVGKTPLHASEAPQNVNGLRQVSYRSVKSVEVSRRITNGQSEGLSERQRITDSESVAGRRDDFRRSRTPQDDDKPFRPFKRNFDSDKKTDRDDAGSSRKFPSNKSETGSARGKGRDDRRDRDRDRPKRFEKKFDDVKKEDTWADSPASPPPEDKENLEPNLNESKPAELPRHANERKQPELPRKERCSSVEKEEVKTPIKKEKNPTAVLSVSPIRKEVFGLVRESPDSFWVLNANQIDEWQALTIRLQELCESGTKVKPRMGLICGCFFEDMWYRAKIIALEPKIRVHYIDFGNTSEYEDDLIKLPEDVTSQDGMAFLIKFAKGTPKNYEEQCLDGITFPVEVVKETIEYSVIKFVGEKYPDDDDDIADDKKETLEVPKKKEKIPEPEVKDERKSDSSRRDERRREVERKPAESPERKRDTGRRSESPERNVRDMGRKSVGSPERRRDKERRSESPERKRQIERKFQSPERETEPEGRLAAPVKNVLAMRSVKKATPKKDNNRENVFDCLNKGDSGCCFIVSKSGSSLFGCIVPNSNGENKYAKYFEQLGTIPLPKRTFPAEVGDSVLAISDKGYESRGVVMEKKDETYLVNLVDYAATVKVDSVYEMPEDLREFTELGVEVVIQEQLKKNYVYPDEDTIFLFTITGNFDGEKFPCLLTLQDDDDTETQIAKAFIKKWAPEQSASGPLKSGSIVVISCLVSFRKVWVRLSGEAAEAELREISDKLEEHARSAERYKKPPKVGELCCVKFIEDGDYYRAAVESVDESMVVVRFIDYGNEQEGKFSELLRLSEEFKSIPPFAYEIELIGAPDTSQDKKLATYYMKLLSTNCNLVLTYEGDIKNGVILTEKETGTVVNDVAKEKMTQMKK